jgi:hypothetical protein
MAGEESAWEFGKGNDHKFVTTDCAKQMGRALK